MNSDRHRAGRRAIVNLDTEQNLKARREWVRRVGPWQRREESLVGHCFSRRNSCSRGKLFYRLVQQAVAVDPAPYRSLVADWDDEPP